MRLRRAKPVLRKTVRLPGRISRGATLDDRPGTALRLLVLAITPREWIGVDLGSGAFVRVQLSARSESESDEPQGGPAALRPQSFDIIALELAGRESPQDPARPEAVLQRGEPTLLGRPRRRRVRRYLRWISVHERAGAVVLGTRGPSLAYVDVDSSAPSVELLYLGRRNLALQRLDEEVRLKFSFAGIAQSLPVAGASLSDLAPSSPKASLGRQELIHLLGYKPEFVLVALGDVRAGHVPKMLFCVLPARAPRRQGLAEVLPAETEGSG